MRSTEVMGTLSIQFCCLKHPSEDLATLCKVGVKYFVVEFTGETLAFFPFFILKLNTDFHGTTTLSPSNGPRIVLMFTEVCLVWSNNLTLRVQIICE